MSGTMGPTTFFKTNFEPEATAAFDQILKVAKASMQDRVTVGGMDLSGELENLVRTKVLAAGFKSLNSVSDYQGSFVEVTGNPFAEQNARAAAEVYVQKIDALMRAKKVTVSGRDVLVHISVPIEAEQYVKAAFPKWKDVRFESENYGGGDCVRLVG